LNDELTIWQHYNNWGRSSCVHNGRSPIEKEFWIQ